MYFPVLARVPLSDVSKLICLLWGLFVFQFKFLVGDQDSELSPHKIGIKYWCFICMILPHYIEALPIIIIDAPPSIKNMSKIIHVFVFLNCTVKMNVFSFSWFSQPFHFLYFIILFLKYRIHILIGFNQ